MSERAADISRIYGGLVAVLIIASLTALSSCGSEASRDPSSAPEKTGDGWRVSSPAAVGARVSLLDSMIGEIETGEYVNIHSVLAAKDGALVFEEYFEGNDRKTLHEIRSATKSIGSMLVGIAIDRGLLPSENEPVHTFFENDYEPSYSWTPRAKQVELGHLMSMMSGYDCSDLTTDFACEDAMYETDDWVQYALDLPFAHDPDAHWAYNSSSLILVGEAVARTSGLNVDEFADRYLFEPLGIKRFHWMRSPKGRAWIGGGARMIPREMAKIGQLMLDGGMRDGQRLLSEDWIEKSTHKQGEMVGAGVDYGYLWQRGWSYIGAKRVTGYWASGNGGQYIIVLPDNGMVVVFTGGNYNSPLASQPFDLLVSYILPAFFHSQPLEVIALTTEEMQRLTGIYEIDFDPSATSTVYVDGDRLRLTSPDDEIIDLVAHSPTFFTGRSRHGHLTFVFEETPQGEIFRHVVYGGFQRFVLDKR
jgi:CubicO group peptidase (beta-lactamase class C family)